MTSIFDCVKWQTSTFGVDLYKKKLAFAAEAVKGLRFASMNAPN
jgi:hypothetical protein